MSARQRSRWPIVPKLGSQEHSNSSEGQANPQPRRRVPRGRILFWVTTATIVISASVYVRAEIHRRIASLEYGPVMGTPTSGGSLLIAGGGPLSEMIRHRFIELAGGAEARIVVIPAEVVDEQMQGDYREMWLKYGVKAVDVLHTTSRSLADRPEFSQMLESATGVWLGGGQQTWLAEWYGGTLVETRLKEVLARNGVIGGTSAGAAIMSGVMIAGGRRSPVIKRGFDLIPEAVIDQHFVKRNRVNRLYQVLEQYPKLVGFGIDEATALHYSIKSGRFQVLGQSCVVACVMEHEDNLSPKFRLQFLNPGDEFDIQRLRRGEQIESAFTDFDAVLFGE